jgi:hypothetical protein
MAGKKFCKNAVIGGNVPDFPWHLPLVWFQAFKIHADSPVVTFALGIVNRPGRVKIKNIVGYHIP